LLDSTCDAWVRNCNIHSSSADPYQVGINSNGSNILVHDCKLVGFYGQAISANGGRVSAQGNMFWNGAVFVAGAGNGSIISGNFVTRPAVLTPGLGERAAASGDTHPALISLKGHGIVVSGNNIRDEAPAGDILELGASQSVMVSGNSFSTSDGNSSTQTRWAITTQNASSSSGFVTGNLFVKHNALSPAALAGGSGGGLIATNNWVAGRLQTDSSATATDRSDSDTGE
jgi:hypothetical protein